MNINISDVGINNAEQSLDQIKAGFKLLNKKQKVEFLNMIKGTNLSLTIDINDFDLDSIDWDNILENNDADAIIKILRLIKTSANTGLNLSGKFDNFIEKRKKRKHMIGIALSSGFRVASNAVISWGQAILEETIKSLNGLETNLGKTPGEFTMIHDAKELEEITGKINNILERFPNSLRRLGGISDNAKESLKGIENGLGEITENESYLIDIEDKLHFVIDSLENAPHMIDQALMITNIVAILGIIYHTFRLFGKYNRNTINKQFLLNTLFVSFGLLVFVTSIYYGYIDKYVQQVAGETMNLINEIIESIKVVM